MKKRPSGSCWVPFAMALAFSLVMLTSNSPLFQTYGSDSAIFVTIGRSVAKGAVPYTDIFDHKGPVIFYLNALAQAISSTTTSIWVLEVLFLFASLCVLGRIAGALGTRHVWLPQLAYLALMGIHLDGGNYTEEYCNLFTLLALHWALAFALDDGHPWRYPLGVGAMLGLCAMVRLNNALPIAGLTLAMGAWVLVAQRRVLLRSAAGLLLGLMSTTAPFLAYFGAKGALSAFFYGAIQHNLLYAGVPLFSRAQLLFSSYGGFAVFCALCTLAGLVCGWHSKRPALCAYWAGLLCSAVFAGGSTLLSSKGYGHYLLLCIPGAAVGFAAVLSAPQRLARRHHDIAAAMPVAIALAAATLLCWGGVAQVKDARRLLAQYPNYTQNSLTLAAHIPPGERGDVLGYRIEPKWYVASGILPARRLFFMQEILAQADPALMDEIVAMFQQNPPRWLVLPASENIAPIDPRVLAAINAQYEPVAENSYNEVWRLY